MNLNDDKIKYTAECGQPEAPLSNLNRHWATYYHKQGGFKLAAPSCSGFLAWIDPDRFQNGCSRSGDETLFPISNTDTNTELALSNKHRQQHRAVKICMYIFGFGTDISCMSKYALHGDTLTRQVVWW